jgi:hypothetical protein
MTIRLASSFSTTWKGTRTPADHSRNAGRRIRYGLNLIWPVARPSRQMWCSILTTAEGFSQPDFPQGGVSGDPGTGSKAPYRYWLKALKGGGPVFLGVPVLHCHFRCDFPACTDASADAPPDVVSSVDASSPSDLVSPAGVPPMLTSYMFPCFG